MKNKIIACWITTVGLITGSLAGCVSEKQHQATPKDQEKERKK